MASRDYSISGEQQQQQQQGGSSSGKWEDTGVTTTDHERELYERARNAANEAEREGDAQLQAAVAAARVLNQAIVAPTHMNRWSLKFHCDRLEAAYRRKCSTNSQFYDYVPVGLKTALCLPHLLLVLAWLQSPSYLLYKRTGLSSTHPELTFHELWSVCALLPCLVTLGCQGIWPLWYRSNRGTMLQYLVLSLWVWEGVKLLLNANDAKYILMEVVFVNLFMSVLHRVPFSLHCRLRSYGSALQAVAIVCKPVDINMRLQFFCLAIVSHLAGLGLGYFLDRCARKMFLSSLPVWLLEDLAGNRTQGPGYLTYRESFSRQLWGIFYPELLGNPQSSDKPVTHSQGAPRRALGGFAGGFGGVSSLKCTGPYSSNISPPSSSSSLSGGGSSDSSENWGGVGQPSSGISCGEVLPAARNISGPLTRVPGQWGGAFTSSASSQVGLKYIQSPYVRNRAPTRGGGISGGYY